MNSADRVTMIVPTYDAERSFPFFVQSLHSSLGEVPRVVILRHRNELLDPEPAARYDAMLAAIDTKERRFLIEQIDGDFNYSAMMNRAVKRLDPAVEFVCLSNDDIIFSRNDWLDTMVEVFDRNPAVAIVGCRLLYPSDPGTPLDELVLQPEQHFGTVQHAGVSIVQGKGTTLIYKGRPYDHPAVTRDRVVEAVTFALAIVRRSLFEEQQFDTNLDWDFNDADFCLQAGNRGHKIGYCAASIHFHLETVTRRKYGLHGKPDNRDYFMRKWRSRIDRAMSLDDFTKMEPYHR